MSITLEALKESDPSLKVVYPNGLDLNTRVTSLTGVSSLKHDSIVFIKNKKFYKTFLEQEIEKPLNIGIIFEKSFWLELSQMDDWKNLASKISFAFSCDDINLAISWLSKPFYDEKCKDLNNVVDGRQMGTCEIHPTAWIAQNVFIGENVKIGANVSIHPGCVIMSEVEIGDDSVLYPNVTLYPWVLLGKHSRIHSGTVIGSDGFGYNFHQGEHLKVWHFGGVIIQDNVEIGANCTIDMGTFNPTVIGRGSKIDNQVHLGHNNTLGTGVILCGKVGTAGSVSIGNFTVLGGEVSIGPDIKIGDQCQIAGGAKVLSDLPEKSKVAGHPARPLNEWLRGVAYLRKISLKRGE